LCAYDINPADSVTISHLGVLPYDSYTSKKHNTRLDNGSNNYEWGAHLEPQTSELVEPGAHEHTGNEVCRRFMFTPTPTQGGLYENICFTAEDSEGDCRVSQKTVHCIMVKVRQCKWHVQNEDALVEVAARFDTNWLQLWHLNPSLHHPGYSLTVGTDINVGHLYTVEGSDTLEELSERFGTSVDQIINLNYWIKAWLESEMDWMTLEGENIYEGETLCILPNSCKTSTDEACYGSANGEPGGHCHKRW